jgi:4-amino-4-deoxy-L-arabinose transferase-like glycosyltransferase
MTDALKQRILLVLKIITGIASVYYVALFLYISLSRLSFPFALDWIEGPTLIQVNRVLLGQELYIEPSVSYVPMVYQPLYFYVAAAFTKLLGFGLSPSRLVSILASSGNILLIFLITRKVSVSNFAGIISAGLFAATNGIVWTWFDFARVDTLCVFFSLLGLYFLLKGNIYTAILAGLFFTLSLFTKQSAIIIILPTFAFYFLMKRKEALLFITTVGLLSAAAVFLLNYDSNGWYYFYAFKLPSYHRMDTNPVQISYIVTSLTEPILTFIGIILISILTNLKKVIKDKHYIFFLSLAGCTTVLSMISALSIGATRNAFIPAYALIAIACGQGFHILQENISVLLPDKAGFACNILLGIACLLQFFFLQYQARPYIPTTQDFNRAKALTKELQESDEEFLFPSQSYLALFVHKKAYYHAATLGELTGWYGKSLPEDSQVIKEIQEIVQSKRISAIYLTEPSHEWMGMHCEKEDTRRSNNSSKFIPTVYKMRCY